MTGEVASREAQAAEVLQQHDQCLVTDDYQFACRCGARLPPDEPQPAHQVAMLAAAGLLAPPPPRTWTAGDPEPDDARAVVDWEGDVWQQFYDHDDDGNATPTGVWYCGPDERAWDYLAAKQAPLVEVHLPTGAGQ